MQPELGEVDPGEAHQPLWPLTGMTKTRVVGHRNGASGINAYVQHQSTTVRRATRPMPPLRHELQTNHADTNACVLSLQSDATLYPAFLFRQCRKRSAQLRRGHGGSRKATGPPPLLAGPNLCARQAIEMYLYLGQLESRHRAGTPEAHPNATSFHCRHQQHRRQAPSHSSPTSKYSGKASSRQQHKATLSVARFLLWVLDWLQVVPSSNLGVAPMALSFFSVLRFLHPVRSFFFFSS